MDRKEWGKHCFVQINFYCSQTSTHALTVNLDVHNMEDIVWNTKVFNFVVAENETKGLVQAVATNQFRTAENTDLIRGKGNSLFIPFHG